MPFDWVTANSGCFYRLGRLVKATNSHLLNAGTTLPAELKSIADPFELSDTTDLIADVYQVYADMQGQEVGNRQKIAGYADRILTHRDTVLVPLGLTSADLSAVLTALVDRQAADAQTVKRAVATLGTVTAGVSNVGNGTVLVTTRLDGVNPPIAGGFAHLRYAGLLSEMCVPSETMTARCLADSYRDGTAAGAEQFSWAGNIADAPFGFNAEGSGDGPTLTAAAGLSKVTDGGFENWSDAATPSSWTVDSGAARVAQETSVVYRESSALKMTGDGATATIAVSQAFGVQTVQARRMYCLTVRMKSSSVPAAGTFEVLFTGTGYTAAGSDKVSVAAASMPGSYTLYSAFVLMPASIPSDFKLVVRVTGTLSNGVSVYADDVTLTEVAYHGGHGAVAVQGSVPFVVGDSFTWTVSQTGAVFQDFFRRKYGLQLLSVGGGTETIGEALAS